MPHELASYLTGSPIATARTVLFALAALLLAAAWCDLRRQRIPNSLVVSGALLGLLVHTVMPSGDGFLAYLPGGLGPWGSFSGMLCALLVLFPLYALGGMGAGDVKLMAMVAAFLGAEHLAWVLLATALAGGMLALAVAVRRKLLLTVLQNLTLIAWNGILGIGSRPTVPDRSNIAPSASLPFGVAIAAGSIAYSLFKARLMGLI